VDEHKTDGEHSLSLEMLREMRREWMGSALHQYKWEVGRGRPLSEDWKHGMRLAREPGAGSGEKESGEQGLL
jgi:hypothetical protein